MGLWLHREIRVLVSLLAAAALIPSCWACSVLSHEAVVDALWDVNLKPALLARFPQATPDELKKAHGYAYGGAIIQDLGYYPHGSKQFSDMAHYIRTGDLIIALISESQTLEELSFALGALSHYVSDIDVHKYATNRCEAMLYPKLESKFGAVITYEQDPAAHLKTEFGFDVLEVAKGRFAPAAYHDFIGFYVAAPLLNRAFRDTYGLELADLFPNFDRTIGSYRRAVSKTIPRATRIAWAQRKDEIQRSEPGMTRRRFVYHMRRSSYERDWGRQYDKPKLGDHILAFLLRLIPPIGPLRALKFKMPTPAVEKIFMESFNRAVEQYRARLDDSAANRLHLADVNYDLGDPAKPGTYRLQDNSYAFWLDKLAGKRFATATPQIRETLLDYYQDPKARVETEKHPKEWTRLQTQLGQLKEAVLTSRD